MAAAAFPQPQRPLWTAGRVSVPPLVPLPSSTAVRHTTGMTGGTVWGRPAPLTGSSSCGTTWRVRFGNGGRRRSCYTFEGRYAMIRLIQYR